MICAHSTPLFDQYPPLLNFDYYRRIHVEHGFNDRYNRIPHDCVITIYEKGAVTRRTLHKSTGFMSSETLVVWPGRNPIYYIYKPTRNRTTLVFQTAGIEYQFTTKQEIRGQFQEVLRRNFFKKYFLDDFKFLVRPDDPEDNQNLNGTPFSRFSTGKYTQIHTVVQKQTNKRFSIKKIRPEYSQQGFCLNILEKQAYILGQLSHPNIVKLHSKYRLNPDQSRQLLYVMDEIRGDNLEQLLANNRRQGVIASLFWRQKIIKDILLALAYLQQNSIAHRNVCPQNIVHDNQTNNFQLIDFGASEDVGDDLPGLNLDCYPGYMSPEVARQSIAKPQTISDMFSVGVILYEMVYGQKLFPQTSLPDRKRANEQCVFDPPTRISPRNEDDNGQQPHLNTKKLNQQISLLRKMLQIDMKKRISARKALQHPYFLSNRDYQSLLAERRFQKQEVLINKKINARKSKRIQKLKETALRKEMERKNLSKKSKHKNQGTKKRR